MEDSENKLIEKIESYLSGNMSHDQIQEYAWNLSDSSPENIPKEEELYWSSVFTIIHLADGDHWKDSCTQRELSKLIEQLRAK